MHLGSKAGVLTPEVMAVYNASPLAHPGVSAAAHALKGKGIPAPLALPRFWAPRASEASVSNTYRPQAGGCSRPA